jgi:hypothetical protein
MRPSQVFGMRNQNETQIKPSGAGLWLVFALAWCMTLFNAAKPLTVDDSVYVLFTRHISEHPFDPYGFNAWGVQPANTILAPPVFLYWWAGAVRLFGENPVLWKLSLFPIAWLFLSTVQALGRRFATGMERPLLVMMAFSPVVLPCFNLMLDIPALALSLASVVVFIRACEKQSFFGVVLAGLVAGLAVETKYTAFLAPAVIGLYGALYGRKRAAAASFVLAGLMFLAWEVFTSGRYGQSHFTHSASVLGSWFSAKLSLILPLIGQLGATAGGVLLLALVALEKRASLVMATAFSLMLGYVLYTIVPREPLWVSAGNGKPILSMNNLVFGTTGIALIALMAAVVGKLLRSEDRVADGQPHRADLFLALWLVLEIAGYFAISPYPAVRRILGVVLLATLLAFRLASKAAEHPVRRRLIWAVVSVNFAFGLFAFAADYNLYYGEKVLARLAVDAARTVEPNATIWHNAHGAFEYYGERRGMRYCSSPEAEPCAGDLIALLAGAENTGQSVPDGRSWEYVSGWNWQPYLPIRSRYQFGNTAFERSSGPIVRVRLYRKVKTCSGY